MTKNEIIKKLAEKYLEVNKEWIVANCDMAEAKCEGQEDLLEELFEELFGIKDLYITEGHLMSHSKKIG